VSPGWKSRPQAPSRWGTPYNPRLPLSWFDDGSLEGYLLPSGSWRNSGSSEFYQAQVRRFRLEHRVFLGKVDTTIPI